MTGHLLVTQQRSAQEPHSDLSLTMLLLWHDMHIMENSRSPWRYAICFVPPGEPNNMTHNNSEGRRHMRIGEDQQGKTNLEENRRGMRRIDKAP